MLGRHDAQGFAARLWTAGVLACFLVSGEGTPARGQTGACCKFDGTCSAITQSDCLLVGGGLFQGAASVCGTGVCPLFVTEPAVPYPSTVYLGQGGGRNVFNVNLAEVYQVIVDGSLLRHSGLNLAGFAGRSGPGGAAFPASGTSVTWSDYLVRVCTPATSATTMSRTFDSNLGADVTVVRSGAMTMPPASLPAGAGIHPFGGYVPFQSTFACPGGEPSSLLLEVRHSVANVTSPLDPFLDSVFYPTFTAVSAPSRDATLGGQAPAFAARLVFAGNPGAIGACCTADGSCQEITLSACVAGTGGYRGAGVTCDAISSCPQPGSCCAFDATCTVVWQRDCLSVGSTWIAGVPCSGAPCPPAPCITGAFDGLGSGTSTNPGAVYGIQTGQLVRDNQAHACSFVNSPSIYPNNATNPYAFVRHDFVNPSTEAACVTVVLAVNCPIDPVFMATYIGPYNPADPTANNVSTAGSAATQGTPRTTFSVPPGAVFSVVIVELVSTGNSPLGCGSYAIRVDADGTPLCPVPHGVCCRGATCNANVSQASCTGSGHAGAMFAVAGASCNAGGSTTTPCCYADYNKSGALNTNDIFDFLNDWFGGSPFALTGGDGSSGSLGTQNIFAFLNAWFAGGC